MKGQILRNRPQKDDLSLWVMALPTIIMLLLFAYFPMFGLILAFKDYNITKGIFKSDFVGLKNFKFLFATTDAWVITRNTVLYNLAFIVVNMVVAVMLALLLSNLRSRKTAKTLQTVYMLPYFLSWAVVAIIANAFLDRTNGFINQVVSSVGGTKRLVSAAGDLAMAAGACECVEKCRISDSPVSGCDFRYSAKLL